MYYLLVALIGLLLGVSLAAPPGPVTAVLVNRASRSSMAGIMVGMGAMTADFTLMIITFTLRRLLPLDSYETYFYLAGAIFFAILSLLILLGNEKEEEHVRGGYPTGLFMGLVNPFQIGWWLTAGIAFVQKFGYYPFYFLFAGIVAWVVFLSLTVRYSIMKYGERARNAFRIFSSVTLIFFSAFFSYYFLVSLP